MSPPLTIVLTLKDRTPFTYRWMRYMDDVKCPYPILIADGGQDEAVESDLRSPEHYPNLRYTYIRYPFDKDYQTYYQKLADAVERVTTPYVLLADNDDFFLLDPIPAFIDFLDQHESFISCGGQPVDLYLRSNDHVVLSGPAAVQYEALADERPKSVTEDLGADRVCYFLNHIDRCRLWQTWYQVHRTSAVRGATDVIRAYEFTDPVALELHMHLCLLMAGKYKQLEVLFYVRQQGTSQLTSEMRELGNVVERFIAFNAFGDIQRSLDSFAPVLTSADRERINQGLARWFAAKAIGLYSRPNPVNASAVDPVERLYRFMRRQLRPIAAALRPKPRVLPPLRLPAIEKYILDPAP